jgi:hypothetical protein
MMSLYITQETVIGWFWSRCPLVAILTWADGLSKRCAGVKHLGYEPWVRTHDYSQGISQVQEGFYK